MNDELSYLSALELGEAFRARTLSPVEITEAALTRIDTLEPHLNAMVTITPEIALSAARDAEARYRDGVPLGPLDGVPVSVKDLIPVGGVRCAFGSRTQADNVAGADAPAVERLKAAGMAIVGKTTTSEFGCKAVGDCPLTGITRNPWNLAKTPGGSSAGAAAGIAAGYTPFGIGTDGGGSVRIPAALTGLFAIKANFARVPVFPVSATPTLAHIGPMARTVRDAAMLLSSIAGFDRRDAYSVDGPVPDFAAACDQSVKGMRIAWSPTLGYARPDTEVVEIAEAAAMAFQELGCEVDLVEDPIGADPAPMWMSEFYAGVGVRLREALSSTPDLLDPDVAVVLSGALEQSLEDYYAKVFERYTFREKMRQFFETYDLLLSPTLPVSGVEAGTSLPPGHEHRNIVSWVYYAYPFNLTGQPAASIPAGFAADGLPVGLQMVSRINAETDIFRAAAAFEALRPWGHERPNSS